MEINAATNREINCAVECVNGCKLGDDCPNKEHQAQTAKFIAETSLDSMLAMAEEAVRKKMLARTYEAPEWVYPEDGIQNPEA
jgi:hypothetical protein